MDENKLISEITKDYFANAPADQIGSELVSVVEDYYNYCLTSGRLGMWRRLDEQFYKGQSTGGLIEVSGAQGEFKYLNPNHFRNILLHIVNQSTAQRPAINPQAQNTDYKSQSQTIVAKGVIGYYEKTKGLEKKQNDTFLKANLFGIAGLYNGWDVEAGEPFDKDEATGKILKEGDCEFRAYDPMSMIFDYTLKNDDKRQWMIVRDYENKYDLAAQYPSREKDILNCDPEDDLNYLLRNISLQNSSLDRRELIPVYRFFHDKSPAVPAGRMVTFLTSKIVLFDGPLAYKCLPVSICRPSERNGDAFGYSIAYDLLNIQTAINILSSIIFSNQSQFGIQNIMLPEGSKIEPSTIMDGLNMFYYKIQNGQAYKPESLNLTNTPAEIFNWYRMLVEIMETISGINSVARGNPEASLKSGSALALVLSQSIQFNRDSQFAYITLLESTSNAVIDLLKAFANTKRVAMITGISNRSYLKEFSGQDLQYISRVTVEIGNPLMNTTAGRLQIAEDLLSKGFIKTPEEYLMVLNTGRLEPMYEYQQAELMLIRSENEKMLETTPQPVLRTDRHSIHIPEHLAKLCSPEVRENPQLMKTFLDHIQQHEMFATQYSITGQILNEPQLMPPPMPQVPQGMLPLLGGGQGGGAPEVMNGANPTVKRAATVNMPSMPTNPLTGEKFNNVTGGL